MLKRASLGCERASCADPRRYPGFLDVHHILGVEKSDRKWNCVALCLKCHRDAHFAVASFGLAYDHDWLLRLATSHLGGSLGAHTDC